MLATSGETGIATELDGANLQRYQLIYFEQVPEAAKFAEPRHCILSSLANMDSTDRFARHSVVDRRTHLVHRVAVRPGENTFAFSLAKASPWVPFYTCGTAAQPPSPPFVPGPSFWGAALSLLPAALRILVGRPMPPLSSTLLCSYEMELGLRKTYIRRAKMPLFRFEIIRREPVLLKIWSERIGYWLHSDFWSGGQGCAARACTSGR